MRKIDTEAYNKRLHTEIMELDKMIKSINPENVNQIDATLIETADRYTKLISDATWADNSNFNGIEMHKIKDLLSTLRSKDLDVFIRNVVISQPDYDLDSGSEIVVFHRIQVESGYDGRKSLFLPRIRAFNSQEKKMLTFEPFAYGAFSDWRINYKLITRKTKSTITVDVALDRSVFPEDYEYVLQLFYILWK